MGCDVHPYVEFFSNGEWKYYGQVASQRNYYFFGLLSNVRGEGPQHFAVMANDAAESDLSETMSKEVREAWEQGVGDWHTLSVGGVDERHDMMDTLAEETDTDSKAHTVPRVKEWLKVLTSLKRMRGVEDARIVLWYDN